MNSRGLEEGTEIPKDIPAMKIIYRIAGKFLKLKKKH